MRAIGLDSVANMLGVDTQHAVVGMIVVLGFGALLMAGFILFDAVRLRRSRLIDGSIGDFAYTFLSQTLFHTNLVVDVVLPSGETKRFRDRSDIGSRPFAKGQAVPVWYHERSGRMSIAHDQQATGRRLRTGIQWLLAGAAILSAGIWLILHIGPVLRV